jgi:RNA polymerase sigma factor (sigma-70 family)
VDFVDAYEEHVYDVYGFLAYRAGSRQEAEDLTQETFERALKAWPRFDPARSEARTWLLVIARNTYIDSRRRQSARPRETPIEELDLGGAEDTEARLGVEPELAAAIRRLSRREREAIALRFGGDLRVAEVAEVLGVSVANAQQILSRALKQLRSMLGAGQEPVSRADRRG